MRVGFRRVPADLILVAVMALLSLGLVGIGVGGPIRYLLAVALVFFLPGYGIVAALFPRQGELDWVRRIGLGVGLSLAAVALLGLLLDVLPGGLNVASITGSLLGLSLATAAVAAWRRLQVPEAERLGLSLDLALPRWGDFRGADRLIALGVAVALVSGIGVVAVGLAHPPAADRYTELYLLDSGGALYNYPLSLNASQPATVTVGVHNMEGASVNYTVIVILEGVQTVYNATSGTNDTIVTNTTFLGSFPVNLASGARSEQPYPFSIPFPGVYLLEFRLYVGAPQGGPYRFVDLHVHVV